MSRIIQLLIKNHVFFLFIFLECVSLKLFVSNNFVAESNFSKKATTLRSFFFEKEQEIKDYFCLKEENRELLEANTSLIKKLSALNNNTEFNNTTNRDSMMIIRSKIVRNSWNKKQNFITINSGQKHGIEPNMGAVNHLNNLIGITHTTSENFSTIISILNTELMVSAKIKNLGHYGTLSWDGKKPEIVQLHDIPKHANVKIGDTIVTSGYSNILKDDINIGKVIGHTNQPNTNFLNISVNLFVDFTNIKYVYIMNELFKSERDSIEKKL